MKLYARDGWRRLKIRLLRDKFMLGRKGRLKSLFAIAVCTLTTNSPATGQLYCAPGRQGNRAGTYGTSAVTAKHLGLPEAVSDIQFQICV